MLCKPRVTIDLVGVLLRHNACSTEQACALLKHPRMRKHLASASWHLNRLKLNLEDKRSDRFQSPPAHLVGQYNREELYEKVWSLRPARWQSTMDFLTFVSESCASCSKSQNLVVAIGLTGQQENRRRNAQPCRRWRFERQGSKLEWPKEATFISCAGVNARCVALTI
jgi:hypothetical protein